MVQVDLNCADCGAHITELPFQPSGDKPVYCRDCLRNKRANAPRPARQMFDVDLNCAQCGAHIDKLPFQPSGARPVYCFNCNKSRAQA
jgi:CxxC-x17-CxxC domain-containing protein